VTTNDPRPLPAHPPTGTGVEDVFAGAEPVRSAADLARDGVFDDDEITDFLSDLYAMRRSDVA
jgi:hypothetical protein